MLACKTGIMNRWLSRLLIMAALVGFGLEAGAASSRCGVCRHLLDRAYWNYKDVACCSQACIDQLRPTCSTCSHIIRSNFLVVDENIFCSQECFTKTLPKCDLCSDPIKAGFTITRHHYCERCMTQSPTCFSCGLPAAHPATLDDDREVCNPCMRWSVKTQEMAERHYDRARRHLEAWTGLQLETVPALELVDRNEMNRHSKKLRKTDSPVSIRGLYSRQVTITSRHIFGRWKEETTDEQETIYLVDHLHDEVFRVAAVHELMHDLIHEYFPRLKDAPLWVQEGICQQAAAEYARRRNYVDILHGIDHCDDPDYGDGYRYINQLTGFEGWRALQRWMETVDVKKLPRKAPR